MEQKESLDFYATMTGFVAWKDKMDESMNDSQCSLDFFKMKPQKNGFQGNLPSSFLAFGRFISNLLIPKIRDLVRSCKYFIKRSFQIIFLV